MKRKILLAFMLSLGIFATTGVCTYAQTSCDSTSAVVGYNTADESYTDSTQGIIWKYKLNTAQNQDNEDFITDLTCIVQNPILLGKTQSITIPDSINGVKVTEIGNNAFKDNTIVKNITISNNINRICSDAFSGCSGLESITIGNNVTKMGDNVFSGCSKLKEATFGTGLFEDNIGSYIFSECTSLTTINVNKAGAVTIPEGFAFGCTALENVNVLQNANLSTLKIGANAFKSAALKTVRINAPVTVGNNAFSECKELEEISFGSDTTLNEGAFEYAGATNCKLQFNGTGNVTLGKNSLKNALCSVEFSKNLNKIILDDGCFDNTNLETLNLEGKRVLIKKNALTGLKASAVNFNNTSETEIDGDMFETDNNKCKEMDFSSKTVYLAPSKVTQNRVFIHAKALKTVKFKNSVQEIYGNLKGDCYLENVYIYNPRTVSELIKDVSCTKNFTCHTYINGEEAKTKLFKDGGCTYKNIVQNISVSAKTTLTDGDIITGQKVKVTATLTDGAEVELSEGSESDVLGYYWKDKAIKPSMTLIFMGKEWKFSLNTVAPTSTPKPLSTKTPTPTPYYSVTITNTPSGVTIIPTPSTVPITVTEVVKRIPTPMPKAEKTTKLTVKNNGKKISLYNKDKKIKYKTYVNKLYFTANANPSTVKVYYQVVKYGKKINDKRWKHIKKNQKISFKKQGKYCVYFKFTNKGKIVVKKTTGFYIDTKAPTVNITKDLTVKVSDSGSGIQSIKVNGIKVKNGYKLQKLQMGDNDIDIVVTDKVGNKKRIKVKF